MYINELVQELLDNTSIFYYDALLKIKKKQPAQMVTLNSVLKLWLPLMWLPQPSDFKWLWKQFCTFVMVEISHTQ